MMLEVSTKDIVPGKILWVGGYPAHYVRQMHLAVETMRPGVMHFIYIDDRATMPERSYEQGQLPTDSTVLKVNYPVRKFLTILSAYRPKMLVVTGYNRRLLATTLIWSYWKRVRFCFWCDTNLLSTLAQSPLYLQLKKVILKLIFSHAHKFLYMGSRNRDFYVWVLGLRFTIDNLFFLPYPAVLANIPKLKPIKSETLRQQQGKCFNILYLGRLEPIKAIHKLLKAFALLPKGTSKHMYLDIYGGGSEEIRLKEIAIKHGISELVSFHGPVASDQVVQAYAKADLFVLPSDMEPWGLVVNEAMLAGVPVMCPFWVGAAADLITDGETGYILDNNTPECIAAGIQRAYSLGGLANKRLGLQGRDRIVKNGWTVGGASIRLASLLDEILRE